MPFLKLRRFDTANNREDSDVLINPRYIIHIEGKTWVQDGKSSAYSAVHTTQKSMNVRESVEQIYKLSGSSLQC